MLQEMKQEAGRINWTQAGAKLERLIRLCENGQSNTDEAVALVKDVYEMQYALERIYADASRIQENERMDSKADADADEGNADEGNADEGNEKVSMRKVSDEINELKIDAGFRIEGIVKELKTVEQDMKDLRSAVETGVHIETDAVREYHSENAKRLADNVWVVCEKIYEIQEARRFQEHFGDIEMGE